MKFGQLLMEIRVKSWVTFAFEIKYDISIVDVSPSNLNGNEDVKYNSNRQVIVHRYHDGDF